MAQCECLEGCPFFHDKMENMPSMAETYKNKYCLGDFEECARYIVFSKKGKPAVPKNLFPNQKEKALAIVNS